MENTIENKAKFIAQYWGCDVYEHRTWTTEKLWKIGGVQSCFDTYSLKSGYLRLKPLSSISDEDAIEVAKLGLGYSKLSQNISLTKTTEKCFGFSFWLNHQKEYAINFDDFYNPVLYCLSEVTTADKYLHNVCKICDYLRSKSYALPFNNVDVKQQVQYGWVKLKTD